MILTVLVAATVAFVLLNLRQSWLAWVASGGALLAGWWVSARPTGGLGTTTFFVLTGLFALLAIVTGVPSLRRSLITARVLPLIAPILPRMSETEKIAIEAGTVGWEADFFTGAPNWRKLLHFQPKELTPRERAFLDGPCEKACAMLTDWEVMQRGDLSKEAWEFIKHQGFLGMIIPEQYGGLGFSAAAHSAVVRKLASRCTALTVSVMVPNSLGPAELLLHYGTDQQKKHYLPRLAKGEEIPCFALTEPHAGSDAGSMRSRGVVEEGTFNGKKVLGMRLSWDKRYITLAPVATVIGLAFRLFDPDKKLGDVEDLGITCALIPADLPGVEIGERHDPLGTAFMNGPTRGKDVFVPLDFIIGGKEMAGRGWLMLMQSLAAGRGISLPSMASGAAQLALRTAAGYAGVRQQFGMDIGRFEGIQQHLARIGGLTYLMDATRRLTTGAVDNDEKPSVASAIAKCYLTESMRQCVNDAMDVVGGAGICMGPRNVLGGGYIGLPIGITVEGANILTRTMIIFGQGAIRCHPFVQDEMKSAFEKDVALFDRSFWGHVGFVFQNFARTLWLSVTNGAFVGTPVSTSAAVHYKHATRLSSAFALAADLAMGTLGGTLKRKEALTGRLADIHAWLYLSSAALKRFYDEGSKERDLPALHWACAHAHHQAENAFMGFLENLPLRPAAWLLRILAFPFGRSFAAPDDNLSHALARSLVDGDALRSHLTRGIYVPDHDELGLGLLEGALEKIARTQPAQKKVHTAVREKRLEKKPAATLLDRAVEAGILTSDERSEIEEAERARAAAIAVDSFPRLNYAEMSA
jgi:acyl-CoA dehydrogenase